jgi:purine-cytosine permease-like protein
MGKGSSATAEGLHATSAGDAAWSIETHGIDIIPESDRHGKASELFWLWLATNVIIMYVIEGIIVASLGLSFYLALAAIVIGNLFYFVVAACGLPGHVTGTAEMVVARASLGRRGSAFPTVLSWITVVGWEAVNFVLGTFALIALVGQIGIPVNTTVKAICLGLTIIVTFAVAILGHATIVRLQTIFTWVLGIVVLGVLVQVLPHANFGAGGGTLAASSTFATFVLATVIVAGLGPLSWVNIVADYNRYLPKATRARSIVGWIVLGSIVPSILITLIGLIAAGATNMTDPIGGFKPLLAGWYFVVFMVVVVIGSMMNNVVGIYSGGLQLLALGLKIDRWKTIPLDGVLATGASVYAVFFHDFTSTMIQFLSLYIIWLAPWCAIYLTDMWMRRNIYNSEELIRERGGLYWFRNGYNVGGLIAWVVGAVVAGLTLNTTLWSNFIVTHVIGGADVSIPAGMLAAGLTYFLLNRRTAQVPSAATATLK